jgi:hypothetical protein
MVAEVDAHYLAGVIDGLCYLVIHAAGTGIVRGVVMDDGKDGSVVGHSVFHDKADVHQRFRDTSLRQLDVLDESIVLIHEEQVGFFAFEVLAKGLHELMYPTGG